MLGAALAAGGVFGAKHALEADHVAAVATLVDETDTTIATGAAWGVGHSIPIVLLGITFLAAGLELPPGVAAGFEVVVAVVLVALGLRAIAGRQALGTALLSHVHDDGTHRHLRLGSGAVGLTHSHADEESFAVGIVHGLAGSGGVVIGMTAAAPTAIGGLAFLSGFAVATVAAMATITAGWGRLVGHAGTLRIVAGLLSVCVGLLLLVESIPLW
jgi:hypothetical protein